MSPIVVVDRWSILKRVIAPPKNERRHLRASAAVSCFLRGTETFLPQSSQYKVFQSVILARAVVQGGRSPI